MIGAHIVTDMDEIRELKRRECNVVQMFVDHMASKELRVEYRKMRDYMMREGMKCVVHISYTINCAQLWNEHSWWMLQLVQEIEMANLVGASYVVLHLGKQMDLTMGEGYNNMYMALLHVHSRTKELSHIKILLETSTGQGSEMCFKLEDLAHFYRKFSKHKNELIRDRFGICIDTCHIFAAGYDLRTKEMGKIYLDNFNELIGLEHVKLVHVNDAKKDLGSNVDRHANLGDGFIGKMGILTFVTYFMRLGVPLVLETPVEGRDEDILMLRSIHKLL